MWSAFFLFLLGVFGVVLGGQLSGFDAGIEQKRSDYQPYGWLFSRRPDKYDYDVVKRAKLPRNPYSWDISGNCALSTEAKIHFLTSPGYFLAAMASNERLKKYESTIGAHLEKVDSALDEEIANLKSKIKELQNYNKESVQRETDLNRRQNHLRTQIARDKTYLEEKAREFEKINEKRRHEEEKIREEEENLEKLKEHNIRMRRELDDLLEEVGILTEEMRSSEVRGQKREHLHAIQSMEKSLEKLQQKKAAQDNTVRRLRKDVAYIEEALGKVDNRLLEEVRRQSETFDLERKAKIYEKERSEVADEFSAVIGHLLSEDSDRQIKERKEWAVARNTELLTNMLSANCEFLERETRRQFEKAKDLEKRNDSLKRKLDEMIYEYDRIRLLKGDNSERRDFSVQPLETFETKRLLNEKIKQRESEYEDLLQKFQDQAMSFTKRKSNSYSEGNTQLENLKKDLLAATRRENALRGKIGRTVERNAVLEEELEALRKELEKTAEEVRKIDADIVAKEDIVIDTVTISTEEEKRRTQLEKKEAELERSIEKLERENKIYEQRLSELSATLYSLNSKIQAGSKNRAKDIEQQTLNLKKELKDLKNSQMNLSKSVAKLQKELELSVVRRDAAVGRAQAVVPLRTNVRGERRNELDSIRNRVERKKRQLERVLVE